MRKVTYGAACSLDGFIAGPNGEVDWIGFSKDVYAIMTEYWKRLDTLLMGRKTWEVASAASSGGHGVPMAGIETYVFSRTLRELPDDTAHLVNSDAGAFVRELKRQPGKEICVFGGGDFARSLFEADVIDEIGLNVQPVLLGSGIPLFQDAGRVKLKLKESRAIAGDCVYLTYGIAHARKASGKRARRATV